MYKVKKKNGGLLECYKDCLMEKGYAQKLGIDFNEIFHPLVNIITIKVLLSLKARQGLELEKLYVKNGFLHGDLEHKIYIHKTEGYIERVKENLFCILNKYLYVLKHALRMLYKKIDTFMKSQYFSISKDDHCPYYKRVDDGTLSLFWSLKCNFQNHK